MILLMILLCFWLFCLFPTAHPLTIDDLLATHGKNHTKGNHTKSDHHHLADPYHHTGDHARGAERFYKTVCKDNSFWTNFRILMIYNSFHFLRPTALVRMLIKLRGINTRSYTVDFSYPWQNLTNERDQSH